jgi:cell division protein FtsL
MKAAKLIAAAMLVPLLIVVVLATAVAITVHQLRAARVHNEQTCVGSALAHRGPG